MKQVALTAEQRTRLRGCQHQRRAALERPHFDTRYCVLNTYRDRHDTDNTLLDIALIPVEDGALRLAQARLFDLRLSPQDTLLDVHGFIAGAPVVAFNRPTHEGLIQDCAHRSLACELPFNWIDPYWLLPGLYPEYGESPRHLGDWQRDFALPDSPLPWAMQQAYLVSRLFLAALGAALRRGLTTPQQLMDAADARQRLLRVR